MIAETVRLIDPPLVVGWDGQLRVTTVEGEPLDPVAADVLIALGGEEPAWLAPVEALQAVQSSMPGEWDPIRLAADAVGQPARARAQIARTTHEPAVLLGLAALGEVQVVRNPMITPREWQLLMAHRRPGVASRAKQHAEVLPPVFAESSDPDARVRVARNPSCPATILSRLAHDPMDQVRRAVGSNPGTPRKILRRMLRDESNRLNVWAAVAANKNLTWAALEKCLRRGPDQAREAAAANPRLPRLRVTTLVASRWSAERRALAGRPASSSKRLAWIERYSRRDQPNWQSLIRARVAAHPNASDETKERVKQLNSFMHGQGGNIPLWRKLAPPAPCEALLIAVAVGALATTLAIRPNAGIILGSSLIIVTMLIRCRTVRPGTKVSRRWGQKQAPTSRRLTPCGRGNLGGRLLFPGLGVVLSITAAQYNHSPGTFSDATPSMTIPGPGDATLPMVRGEPDLAGSPAFRAVASDAQLTATSANIDVLDSEALELQVEMVLNPPGDSASLNGAYARLHSAITACTKDESVSAWNENEPELRSALEALIQASRST